MEQKYFLLASNPAIQTITIKWIHKHQALWMKTICCVHELTKCHKSTHICTISNKSQILIIWNHQLHDKMFHESIYFFYRLLSIFKKCTIFKLTTNVTSLIYDLHLDKRSFLFQLARAMGDGSVHMQYAITCSYEH